MGLLDGRVVIVTGAGGGIGRAHALAFAAEGARVVVNDIGVGLDGSPAGGGSAAQGVVDEIVAAGGEAVTSGANVADWAQAEGLIQTAVENFGGLDILVNNAGITDDNLALRMSDEQWQRVLDTNAGGTFRMCRGAMNQMFRRRKGSIVNIVSVAGLRGNPGQANYSASKAAVIGLTFSMAADHGPDGIRVNCIAPGRCS